MADETPNPEVTPNAPPDAPPADDPALGEAGTKALNAERRARKAAEKAAQTAQTELDKLKAASMSDTERAVAEAKAEGRQAAMAEVNGKLLRWAIHAAAAGKLADPDDAPLLLGDLDQFLDSSGDPSPKAIASAIDRAAPGQTVPCPGRVEAWPAPRWRREPSNGFSMNDEIRRMAGRQ